MSIVDLDIHFKDSNGRDPAEIEVGDTGMYLIRQVNSNDWQIHFFPENNKKAVVGKEREYALLFLSGFKSLINWWVSDENPDPFNTNFEFVTNERQLNFIQRNFGQGSVSVTDNRDGNNIEGTLHLLEVIRNRDAMENITNAYNLVNG